MEVHSGLLEGFVELLSRRVVLVHEQCFGGVADRRILGLGIHDDTRGLVGICGFVDVDVTDAVRMTEYGNASAPLDALDHFV